MAILEEYVEVTLNPQMVTRYEALGYDIPRRRAHGKIRVARGTVIRVKVSDLPPNSTARLTKVCDVCGGHVLDQKYQDTLRVRDNGVDKCRSCAKNVEALQRAKSGHSLAAKCPEVAALWHPTLNGILAPSEVTPGSVRRVWWLCDEDGCGHEWEAVVNSVNRGSRCPVCSMPKGERLIRKYLRFLGYDFTHGKEYNGLLGVNGGQLSYDFVVTYPNGKCALLIEFDGIQHSEPCGHFGGARQLKRQREHDRRKDAHARLHGIPLLRIRHTEFDTIEQRINEALASIIRGGN